MSSPKDFHIDAIYPEPLSRLRRPINDHSSSAAHRRAVKKQIHHRGGARFRTQPVTFHEIKEVDEENITEAETTGSAGALFKSESDLKAKFELFYRSITTTNNENNPVMSTATKQPPPLPLSKLAMTDAKFLKDSNNTGSAESESTSSPPPSSSSCRLLLVNEPSAASAASAAAVAAAASDSATEYSSSPVPPALLTKIITKSDLQTSTTPSSSSTSTPVNIPFNAKSRPSL